MKIIVAALKFEAKAIINYYKNSKDTIVCISGPGKNNCIKAVNEHALKYMNQKNIFINIGICGCKDPFYEKSSVFHINCVLNYESGKFIYPDVIYKSGFYEASITCFDKPWDKNNIPTLLADMESYHFLSSALKYASLDRIHLIKVVSDHMLDRFPKAKEIEEYMEKNIEKITEFR